MLYLCNCGHQAVINWDTFQQGHRCKYCQYTRIAAKNRGRKHTQESILKMSKSSRGKKHSAKTKQKISKASKGKLAGNRNPMFGLTGEKCPNWKTTRSQKDREYRRQYPEYYKWRETVFERDKYVCQVCGEKGVYFVAHHIESYADNKKLQLVLDNGVTICKDCHDEFHIIYGKGGNTRQQLNEYINTRGICA